MKMNSSRLRSAIAAPKLAITMMIALPRLRRRLKRMASSASAKPPVRSIATAPATRSGQPNENGPIDVIAGATRKPIAPMTTSVA